MRLNLAVLFYVFSLCALLIAASSTCYYPDGGIATDHEPCNSSAENSACCSADSVCLSNSYCFSRTGRIIRSSCTDRQWQSSACPYFCRDVYSTSNMGVSSVTISPTSGILFCCGIGFDNATGDCASTTRQMGHKPFNLLDSVVIFNRSTGSTTFPATVPAPNVGTASAASSTTKHDVTVGLGVGLPLLTAALASLGMFHRERRLRMKLAKSQAESGLHNPTTVLVSMGTNKVYEFDGSPPAVKELAASYVAELGENGFQMI